MQIRNGEIYDNNYARAAAYFLGTCADAPEQPSRKAACELITGLYSAVAQDAPSLGLKPSPDVYFGPWEHQSERQQDVKTIRTSNDKVEALAAELFRLVADAEISPDGLLLSSGAKPGRTLLKALQKAGADFRNGKLLVSAGCAEGLLELARVSRENSVAVADRAHFYFSRCVFDPSSDWLEKAFDRAMGADGEIVRLCGALRALGYDRCVCKDGKKLSLDYVKQHGKKAEPVKLSWADKTHSGIELSYEDLRLEPYVLWLRAPMFKTVLERAAELPEGVARFFEKHIKTCSGCRYCVQTDKTGTRPLAAMRLGSVNKCPYYPSYSLNWRALPKQLTDEILAVIGAIDALGL